MVFVVADDTATETDDREVVYTGYLLSHWVAGLAVSLSQSTHNFDHFNVLQLRGIPVVFFDRIGEEIEASNVVVDDCHDAFDVVNHLVNSGYRRIAHLAGPKNLFISKLRLKDYKDGPKASDGSDKWQS